MKVIDRYELNDRISELRSQSRDKIENAVEKVVVNARAFFKAHPDLIVDKDEGTKLFSACVELKELVQGVPE